MKFVDGATVGIDLGTTFSSVAYLDESGQPQPIPNDDDAIETPSIVVFAESGQVIVGATRQRAALEEPDRVVEAIKREMGEADYHRTIAGQELTPEFLSALILKRLKRDAERVLGPVGNAVITVPYYFNDARRKATQDAGRIAGLNVLDIINEPTAAVLCYAWQSGRLGHSTGDERTRTALVYDLGGGTFDVTLVKFTPTSFEVLATDGDTRLGGLDWTDRLVDHVAREYQHRYGSDPRSTPKSLQLLRNDCDLAKIALTEECEVTLVCRHQEKAVSVTVYRDEFEEMTADLVQRTLDTTDMVIEAAGKAPRDVDAVILTGGSTLMPRIAEALRSLVHLEPFGGLSRHTAVAQGAAIHAAILEAKHRPGGGRVGEALRRRLVGIQQHDVNSHGLGVVIRDPRSNHYTNFIMIRRNSPIPMEVRRTFHTVKEDQRKVSVRVVEGNSIDPRACTPLGQVAIDLPPGLPTHAPIEICYAYNVAGRVVVTAKELSSGRAVTATLERPSGLDESQLDAFTQLANAYRLQ
jgi:molecular chaperone DnaK